MTEGGAVFFTRYWCAAKCCPRWFPEEPAVSWGFSGAEERIAGQWSLGRLSEMSDLWPLCQLLACGELFRGSWRSQECFVAVWLLFHTVRFRTYEYVRGNVKTLQKQIETLPILYRV